MPWEGGDMPNSEYKLCGKSSLDPHGSGKFRSVFLRSRRPAAAICEICLDKVGTIVGEKRRESETDGGREGGGVEEMWLKKRNLRLLKSLWY